MLLKRLKRSRELKKLEKIVESDWEFDKQKMQHFTIMPQM